jgi:hypothetical protein
LIAAPVFSEIAQGAVRDLNITAPNPTYDTASMIPMPDFGKDSDGKTPTASSADPDDYLPVLTGSKLTRATPNFAGLSLRRAMELARVSRVNVDVHGGGYVVAQEPSAGAPLNHATVKLTLAAVVADSGVETAADSSVVPASYFSGGGVSPVRRK